MTVAYAPYRDARRVAFTPSSTRLAAVDLYRTEDSFVLSLDLPGVDAGSIDVGVDGRVLTVRAQRTAPSVEGATWITRERQSGAVVRKLSLGDGIDTENISADYSDGVLVVTLPVAERAKPRKVSVSGAPAVETAELAAE